jgi:hypothetical protein
MIVVADGVYGVRFDQVSHARALVNTAMNLQVL